MKQIVFFEQGIHPKTGESQWQARRKAKPDENGERATLCLVVADDSEHKPSEEQPLWLCEVGEPTFVSEDTKFFLIPVNLLSPWSSERNLLFFEKKEGEWQAREKVDGTSVVFVVDRESEQKPSTEAPYWFCEVGNYLIYQSGALIMATVHLKESLPLPLKQLSFHEEADPRGNIRLCQDGGRDHLGINWSFSVDYAHLRRVQESGEMRWMCAPALDDSGREKIIVSANGLFRVALFVPISPVSVSERTIRRRERKEEITSRKQAELEKEREEAQKRAVEHRNRCVEHSTEKNGKKKAKRKAVAKTV
jgi:hypothetical protein